MSVDTFKRPTARELIARGIELDQFERPFPGGASPQAERAAEEEGVNRRHNQERAALGYKELYARGMRALEEEPVQEPPPEADAAPKRKARQADPREEARLESEAALDRRLARLWPGNRD